MRLANQTAIVVFGFELDQRGACTDGIALIDLHARHAEEANKLIAERKQKLAAIRESGQAFPNDFRRDALATDLHSRFGASEPEVLEAEKHHFSLAGRMMLKRVMGKASFCTLQDASFGTTGGRIQVYVKGEDVGAELYASAKRFDNAANTVPLEAYTLLDLRADWQLAPAWRLGLKLNNAADRAYSTANGYQQPGREWFLSLRYSGS